MKSIVSPKERKPIYFLLALLYFFNVTDILFTLLFLSTGAFQEWNPLILWATQSPPLVLSIKIIFIGLLLLYLAFRLRKASLRQIKIAKIMISITATVYGAINLLHIGSLLFYQANSLL